MIRALVLVIAFGFCSVLDAQRQDLRLTLPELARLHAPGPLYQSRTADLVLERLESALSKTDVVVYVSVEGVNTHLSADQKDLYTDYTVRPLRVIHGLNRAPQAQPGPPREIGTIVVTRWGGRMVIDGVKVIQEDADLPAFHVGQQLVLLLAENKVDRKYRLASPVSGTFSVVASRVQPLAKNAAESSVFDRIRGTTLTQFEAEVRQFRR